MRPANAFELISLSLMIAVTEVGCDWRAVVAEEGGCRDSCFGGPSTMVCVADYLQRRRWEGSGAEGADRWGGREGALC